MRRTTFIPLAALAAVLAIPSVAHAAGVDQIFDDYKKQGYVNPCSYAPGDLQRAQGNLPPDVQQYAPRFGEQLGGQCSGGAAPGVVPGVPTQAGVAPVAIAEPKVPKPPAPQEGPASVTLPGNVDSPNVAAAATAARTTGGESVPGWAVALGLLMLVVGFGAPLVARLRGRRNSRGSRTQDVVSDAGLGH